MGGGVTFSASPATVSVPTGSIDIVYGGTKFTVPAGIHVLEVELIKDQGAFAVGVTPGSIHEFNMHVVHGDQASVYSISCSIHDKVFIHGVQLPNYVPILPRILWSPAINEMTPNYTDY